MSAAPVLVALLMTTSPSLETAAGHFKALRFADAARALKVVAASEGLTRDEALEFFLLDGLVKGSLNDAAGALGAFKAALSLDPGATLPGKLAPRVTTPFLEARAWMKQNGALVMKLAPTETSPGHWVVVPEVTNAAGLATQVVLVVVEDGVSRELKLPVTGAPPVTLNGAAVTATATASSARGWKLVATSVSLARPPEVEPRAPEPTVAQTPQVAVPPPAPAPSSPSLVGPLVGLAAGVALGAVGGVNLYAANQTAAQIPRARDAAELDNLVGDGKTQQLIAAVGIPTGAAVAVASTVWLLVQVSQRRPAGVTVGPTPLPGGGALVISGAFP